MKKLVIRIYKEPNMRKARANPRSKNPDTLGPTPYYHKKSYEVTERELEDIRIGGKTRRRIMGEVQEVLRREGYSGMVDVLEHRSPGCNHKLPKYFRKGRGQKKLFSWAIT